MMIMCTMESVVIPRPPPLNLLLRQNEPPSSNGKRSHSSGFRLLENQQPDDTGSVYSVYKQKIDAMFESDTSSTTNTKNSVQARIEKMFTDVAIDNGIPVNDYGCHTFSVDYLGSVPLQEKVTSLSGLQKPLKDLYFAYKRNVKHKKTLTGRLEISAIGLKVMYQGDKGDLEQLNSFPTIAVWSAVKFVLHEDSKTSYAFLPLITDPDNIDKQQLFRTLDSAEKKYINSETHSPLFAVVMRKIGVHKQLECHGFVCQTSEDAIVIAATLYKSLMAHMKAKERKPKNRNGVTCMSVASSSYKDSNLVPVRPPRKKRSNSSSIVSDLDTIDTETAPLISETPKKSVKSRRAPKVPPSSSGEDLDAILPYEEPSKSLQNDGSDAQPKLLLGDKWNTFKSNHQKQITAEIKQVMSESSNMGLKRVKSLRKRNEELKSNENSGDILTKVTIPRSGSFLNAGGLTRYKSKLHRLNGQATGGSPLGFNELFNEFRLHEGLHSMDEILGVIIDPEGMSFNDLKPIYKEFLLKLAVTLTKDELYQRSKSIMRRQKKKLLRRTSSVHTKKNSVVVLSKFKRLKHVFQKFKLVKQVSKTTPQINTEVVAEVESKLPESSISSSSYDTRQFLPKEPTVARKQSYRKRTSEIKATNRLRRDRQSTSEESDFFSLRKSKTKTQHLAHINHNRNSSSGYVSCSECSFDSDTCTCVSADKCYCSLGNQHKQIIPPVKCVDPCKTEDKCYCNKNGSMTYCGCDTDSCTDSNKCYCTRGRKSGTIFEQLKQRGFIPSIEAVTTPPMNRRLCKKNSNTKSTKSLEYMHNPTEKYYEKLRPKSRSVLASKPCTYGGKSMSTDNLALDYELFTISNGGNLHNIHNRTVYSRSLSESGHMCKESMRATNNSSRYSEKGGTTVLPAAPGMEALSVKKSAEIAALFADIKLSQTTDIAQVIPKTHQQSVDHLRRNSFGKFSNTSVHSSRNSTRSGRQIPLNNRMMLTSLYNAKNVPRNNMYSAKNGLYTIQSQSDDSSRGKTEHSNNNGREYFNLKPEFCNKIPVSSSLENSLGYLP